MSIAFLSHLLPPRCSGPAGAQDAIFSHSAAGVLRPCYLKATKANLKWELTFPNIVATSRPGIQFTNSPHLSLLPQIPVPFQPNMLCTRTLSTFAEPRTFVQSHHLSTASKHVASLSVTFSAFFLPTMTFLGEDNYCFQLILWVALISAFLLHRFKQPSHGKQNTEY